MLLALAVVLGVGGIYVGTQRDSVPLGADARAPRVAVAELTYRRLDGPARTVALAPDGAVVATMTDAARTVALAGPKRTLADPGFTTATVSTRTRVRLLPQPWTAGAEAEPWFRAWVTAALADRGPDVLDVAAQYLHDQPTEADAAGVRFRGDAGFGPERGDDRAENSDFYDYLGVPWTFPGGERKEPNPARARDVDCSGFVRLVYGYRMGLPLLGTNTAGRVGDDQGLPRRAYAIAAFGPGAMVIDDRHARVLDYGALQTGDLLFFDLDGDPQLDHVAIYLGLDSDGHHRFVSSRAKADGPTLGDLGGTSLLDDGGYYSRGFRAARRL